jgi:hypothetical protein
VSLISRVTVVSESEGMAPLESGGCRLALIFPMRSCETTQRDHAKPYDAKRLKEITRLYEYVKRLMSYESNERSKAPRPDAYAYAHPRPDRLSLEGS